jgi:hypothetical protein
MNIEKAREHFSAYFEGSMDRGLRQSFERELSQDAQLAAEYRAFEQTMTEVGLLPNIEIEVPDDLHEQIMRRVDLAAWEQERKAPAAGWLSWFRPLLIGTAVLAIAGLAVLQMNNRGTNAAMEANVIPNVTPVAQASLTVNRTETGVRLSYGKAGTVVIRNQKGEILESLKLDANAPKAINTQTQTQVVSVALDNQRPVWIAIPGSEKSVLDANQGSLKELANALAGHYQVPVVLSVDDADQAVTWQPGADQITESAARATESLNLRVELKDPNSPVLWIQKS